METSDCESCSKLTIKTPERRLYRRSGVSIVNFEKILHMVLVFLLMTLHKKMQAGKCDTLMTSSCIMLKNGQTYFKNFAVEGLASQFTLIN